MALLVVTRGLPASGKSTWALKMMAESHPARIVRVNKDLLREMLHGGVYTPGATEHQVVAARDRLVRTFLYKFKCDVIVDDTNLNPAHIKTLQEIAKQIGVGCMIQDFTDVDIDECIRRDASREKSVGEQVIREMAQSWLG